MSKHKINVLWFKRDLRFVDHEPLFYAQQSSLPLLLIYIFEPSIMTYPDSDVRHWRFVHESLEAMREQLKTTSALLHIFHQEAATVFESLLSHFSIQSVFSSEEIGNGLTFKRDKSIKRLFNNHQVTWKEFPTNGIIRGLKNRTNWEKQWTERMTAPPKVIDLPTLNTVSLAEHFFEKIKGENLPAAILIKDKNFQPGGENRAWQYLGSFIKERHVNYSKHISKPLLSRTSCSRISPYLAYGNISMRMVYQYTMEHYTSSRNKKALSNFISRLHWHCHFIQKFESECRYEFENINRAFDEIVKPKNEVFITAWQKGQTGVPIIDACIRCLAATGYINFRMRAMIVSFFVYNLWQDWRELHFLARQFLDYEPGIHYPQLQMQSGTTGVNTIRIYNPIKNAEDHDPDGLFTKQWLPELRHIPGSLVHEPHKLTLMEQQLYQCEIGHHYPAPIVDIEETRKKASEIMWGFRKNDAVKIEAKRIFEKHVNPENPLRKN